LTLVPRSLLAPTTQTPPDLSWCSGWSQAAIGLLRFLEDLIYHRCHDGLLKLGVKARKSPEEILQFSSLQNIITTLEGDMETEAKLAGCTSDTEQAVDGDAEGGTASAASSSDKKQKAGNTKKNELAEVRKFRNPSPTLT
jgi:hypothetical protein